MDSLFLFSLLQFVRGTRHVICLLFGPQVIGSISGPEVDKKGVLIGLSLPEQPAPVGP